MRCPRCDVDLKEAAGAVHEDTCERCGGRFLAAEIVERVVVVELGVKQETLVELAAFFAGTAAPCPACTANMRPVRLRGVAIELCAACGGMWCDRGELARLTEGRHAELATPPPRPEDDDEPGLFARLKGRLADALSVVDAAIDARRAPADPDAYVPLGKGRPGAIWSLVQQSAAPLDVERVRAALARTTRWAPAEATTMVNGACGILVDAVTEDEAATLVRALADEGIEVETVASARLALPWPRAVTRMDVDAEGLHPVDQHGVRGDVPWADVLVVGAALVTRTTTTRTAHRKVAHGLRTIGPQIGAEVDVEIGTTESAELLLDVVLRGEARLRASSKTFVFAQPAADRSAAFALLCTGVAIRASGAALTRGAVDAREGRSPSRAKSAQALEREVAWHAWAASRGQPPRG